MPTTPTENLFTAVAAKDFEAVKKAVAAGANIEAINAQGATPIDLAIHEGADDIAQYLLDARDANAVASTNSEIPLSQPSLGTPAASGAPGDVLDNPPALQQAQKAADSIDSAQSKAAVAALRKEMNAEKNIPPSQRGEKPVRFFQSLVDYLFGAPKSDPSTKAKSPSQPPKTAKGAHTASTPLPPVSPAGNGVPESQILKELSSVPPNASSPAALSVPMPPSVRDAAGGPAAPVTKAPTNAEATAKKTPAPHGGAMSQEPPQTLAALTPAPPSAPETPGPTAVMTAKNAAPSNGGNPPEAATKEKPVDILAYRKKIMPSDAELSKILNLIVDGKGNTPEAYAPTGGKAQPALPKNQGPSETISQNPPKATATASSTTKPDGSVDTLGPKTLDSLLANLPDTPVSGTTFNAPGPTAPLPSLEPTGQKKGSTKKQEAPGGSDFANDPTGELPPLPETVVKDHGPAATVPPETLSSDARKATPPPVPKDIQAAPDSGWDVKSVQTAKISPNEVAGAPLRALGKLLNGESLGLTGGAHLGAPISATMLSNLDRHESCIPKDGKDLIFCIVPLSWPDALVKDFQVDTIMYQGTKAIVRYDNEHATSYQTLFLSKAFDAVIAHYTHLYGPPTRKLARAIAPLAQKRRENPVVMWQSKEEGTGDVVTLEIRKFDDTGDSFPDLHRGVILLYRASSGAIFPVISKLDLMVLKTSVAPKGAQNAPTPDTVW